VNSAPSAIRKFEVSTPELMPGLRLLGFVDAGWVGLRYGAEPPQRGDERVYLSLSVRF
jgi:hypothetical protein